MADYCNKCASKLFGDDAKPEIDVYEEFSLLEENHMISVLCEGCGLMAIGKTVLGELMVVRVSNKEQLDEKLRWEQY